MLSLNERKRKNEIKTIVHMNEYPEKLILNRIQILANKQFNGIISLNTTVNRVCLLLMD
jgi:hypothetical protein